MNKLPLGLVALTLVLSSFFSSASPKSAPDFDIPASLNQPATSLVELSKQGWVYLDFWASWCTPCRYSFPFMNQLQAEFGSKGLTVVAVNVDADRSKAKQFLADNPAEFTVVYDADGNIASAYQVPGMPTSYLIKDGEIVGQHLGFKTSQSAELKQQISQLFNK
ncbi:TlpA family protein disulfide reductase [Photobacterium lipolyticum]|uniref:Thioredoxin domain-containing protein n=1 Tax=Photobacterium lipolyticum TaxID=266810 RepID=A0A2T3N2L4_9GAMM|nr:TlpA disulfide reductase family protein [Photobacterium lipolyticum]PSW06617.1 hypothetical protein C9I89_03510 [Photobacterium lipolyticum]